MYKIIGADGQQYGPVGAEQLRRWIVENRINAQTLVQPEGAQEWKPLSSFPEFADAFAAKPPPPPPSSPLPPLAAPQPKPDAEAMAADILARDYRVEIGSCISRGWTLVTRHFWLIVGATFVIGLVEGVLGCVPVVGVGLAGVCAGGLYLLLLKLIRGERASFGDVFAGFSVAFLQLFLAGLVKGVLTSIGLLLCILPGIYLAVAWMFTLPLVFDKKLEFWPAMELSRKVVTRHWWVLFGLVLLNCLVVVLGLLACYVGVFVAQPVAFGALMYAYEDIFSRQTANRAAA